ncbi:MAG TPA: class D sortase [Thermoanaerobaculia bacterium]|jgi:LPXTG-site transpeptidase (sortase) family protein|nr:class D sortase [Thermoanaerobaculia bacterium]
MKSSTAIPMDMKKPSLRWIERALILIGILCLGAWAWAWIDARIYQYRENQLLEEAAAARRSAPPSRAAETDALGAFREGETPPQEPARSEPKPAGALVGRVEIPRIGVSAIVLEGVDKKTLRRGVGHIPETALPEEGGNVALAAHRDSFFRGLKDIRKNDIITLKTLENTYYYRVDWTEIVLPEDTDVLADSGAPELTLVTCYPFYYVGSAPKRFIVRAQRVDEARALQELRKEDTGG